MDPSVHDILLPGGSVTVEGIWQQHSIALLCQGICDAHQAPCIPRCCWALYHEGQWVFIIFYNWGYDGLWNESNGIYHDISQNMMWISVKMGHADPPNGYIKRRNDDQHWSTIIFIGVADFQTNTTTGEHGWPRQSATDGVEDTRDLILERCFKSPYNCCWNHCSVFVGWQNRCTKPDQHLVKKNAMEDPAFLDDDAPWTNWDSPWWLTTGGDSPCYILLPSIDCHPKTSGKTLAWRRLREVIAWRHPRFIGTAKCTFKILNWSASTVIIPHVPSGKLT